MTPPHGKLTHHQRAEEKRAYRAVVESGKDVARKKGMDFNKDFGAAQNHQIGKGHCEQFLMVLGAEKHA